MVDRKNKLTLNIITFFETNPFDCSQNFVNLFYIFELVRKEPDVQLKQEKIKVAKKTSNKVPKSYKKAVYTFY